jgi:hypothetical protein
MFCIICHREERDLFLNPNEEDILDTNLDELAGAVPTHFFSVNLFLNVAKFFFSKNKFFT